MRPFIAILLASLVTACDPVDDGAAGKTDAATRASRRYYDGAPPVIPHENFGNACVSCHTETGTAIEGHGHAPANPHGETRGLSEASRCEQCHVAASSARLFSNSTFRGLPQDLRRGTRAHVTAPPVIPHPVFMRERCAACHTGTTAREEIRCSHPERTRCRQCHVERTTNELGF